MNNEVLNESTMTICPLHVRASVSETQSEVSEPTLCNWSRISFRASPSDPTPMSTDQSRVHSQPLDSRALRRTRMRPARLFVSSVHMEHAYLVRSFHVLRTVRLDVMMRANGVFEFLVDDDARTLRTRTSNEEHYTSTSVGIEALQKRRVVRFEASIRNAHTSSRPVAMDKAAPVDRSGRFPIGTGHGSRCSSPSRSVSDMSHADIGWMNLNDEAARTMCVRTPKLSA